MQPTRPRLSPHPPGHPTSQYLCPLAHPAGCAPHSHAFPQRHLPGRAGFALGHSAAHLPLRLLQQPSRLSGRRLPARQGFCGRRRGVGVRSERRPQVHLPPWTVSLFQCMPASKPREDVPGFLGRCTCAICISSHRLASSLPTHCNNTPASAPFSTPIWVPCALASSISSLRVVSWVWSRSCSEGGQRTV